jgi:hypothetical protein
MGTFSIKRGDTGPSLLYALEPLSVNLTGGSVVFNMHSARGQAKVERAPAVIVTAIGTPVVRYDWAEGDTDAAGVYRAEFEVTYADDTVETFPASGFITVSIADDLG